MSKFWGSHKKLKVVTFDVFDTLLHRRVRAPVDVFEMVRLKAFEQSFSLLYHDNLSAYTEKRIAAERAARDILISLGGEGEVTLDEIYHELAAMTSLPVDVVDWLKRCELDLEGRLLFPAIEGLKRYREALTRGYAVAFLSDMYLPSTWIANQLEISGYDGAREVPIYVSGEHRASKSRGSLYSVVASSENWGLNDAWLHVGDNTHADIQMAQSLGLVTEWANWGEVDNRLHKNEGEFAATIACSLVSALRSPQRACHLPNDSLGKIGYTVWGPMLFGFICWLSSEIRAKKIEQTIFISRDGWLLKKLFELCQKKVGLEGVATHYFFMSRKLGYLTGSRDWTPERAWSYLSGKTAKSAARAFQAAGLQAQKYISLLHSYGIYDIEASIPERERWRVRDALNAVFQDILRASRDRRDEFSTYFTSPFDFRRDVAFVDIGWLGNMQRCFVHSLPDVSVRDRVNGFYIGLHGQDAMPNEKIGLKLNGWLNSGPRRDEYGTALKTGGVELMEFILTADHGSAVALEKSDGRVIPVFEEQGDFELEHQRKAIEAQAGVLKFFDDHLYLFDIFRPETLACTSWADEFLRMVTAPTPEEVNCLAGLTHSDSPGGNQDRIPLAASMPRRGRLRSSRSKAREESFWKAAFDHLNP